ncbi:hypothetical protein KR018_011363 [Drosophila ironensis]|nr:hypothetical protein KR018_011363 [Drosophila ironensis]
MVNVPPLLSSTPPPMDFGEEEEDDSGLQASLHLDEGDEFPDFGLVSPAKEPPARDSAKEATAIPSPTPTPSPDPVEAFNYQVKQAGDFDVYSEAPPPLQLQLEPELGQEEEEEELGAEEGVPSLKLDSLSLYSTESASASVSTLSPVQGEGEGEAIAETEAAQPQPVIEKAKANVLSHQVTLEDVSDDESDEESSPKKPKELFIREGAEDFFAIEVVVSPTTSPHSPKPQEHQEEHKRSEKSEKSSSHHEEISLPREDMFAAAKELPPLEISPQREAVSVDDDFDDFGDFADFEAAQPEKPLTEEPPTTAAKKEEPADDGFDDFQDFASPVAPPIATPTAAPAQNQIQDDDDDDFGDFSEPVVSAVSVPPPPSRTAAPLSILERTKPVLDAMFPRESDPNSERDTIAERRRPLAQSQRFNFGAIEQARALDYQWSSSEMRHALVRSLGIDSRNILFGDKWNSSMPRFAANLSFDPLKPLKPMSPSNAAASLPQDSGSNFSGNSAAVAPQAGQTEAWTGPPHGEAAASQSPFGHAISNPCHTGDQGASAAAADNPVEPAAAPSAAVVAATAAALPTALPADSTAHQLDGGEQLHQQHQQHHQQQQPEPEQFDLRASGTATPPEEIMGGSLAATSYAVPLKETHIYTPSKSDTAVAKTTITMAPIDFDYEMAATGIKIDETVVMKEYRDVEYKPPFSLDSPSKLASFELPSSVSPSASTVPPSAEKAEDDDFSDFQSMPAPRSRLDEQMILSPAILLPQAIPLAGAKKPEVAAAIEWGDNALASINAEEMARIEELFSSQTAKPPTISATVAKQPSPPAPVSKAAAPPQEDDEWSDFVSVPVAAPTAPSPSNNNNVNHGHSLKKQPAAKDDEWSDFVSSSSPAPQFNSGAWHSANFYNNPLSLYQQQQQHHRHSNLIPAGNAKNQFNHNHINNNNNGGAAPSLPQQIHIMHDFSTAPASGNGSAGGGIVYQQHHQRQQFQIGNAKVAPRISLIPDLSFVAPALPTNAGAFMGSLPKPSFGGGGGKK